MRKYSIIAPTYPPDFSLLHSLIKHINLFTIIEGKYDISEIIFAASEVTEFESRIMEEELNSISKYRVVINGSKDKCNAAKNRNRGWNSVTGDWIIFLDCDDIYHRDKIKVLDQAIDKYKDIYLFLHAYYFNYEHTEIYNNFNKSLNIEDDFVETHDTIFKLSFPTGEWNEITHVYNGNTNLQAEKARIAHGISSVKSDCTVRFPEDFKGGEDGLFCRKVCYNYGGVFLSNLPLMIYNLVQK